MAFSDLLYELNCTDDEHHQHYIAWVRRRSGHNLHKRIDTQFHSEAVAYSIYFVKRCWYLLKHIFYYYFVLVYRKMKTIQINKTAARLSSIHSMQLFRHSYSEESTRIIFYVLFTQRPLGTSI